jgi:glycosyltransferase involved in cell wall biosynthesis
MGENVLFDLKVFYTWGEDSNKPKFDPDFGRVVEWDIPLIEGYQYQFVKNVSKNPGSHHFLGIDNPGLIEEIESWSADIVWVWGWSFKSHLNAIRHFHSKVPVWFRGDSISLEKIKGVKGFLRRFFLKWVYSHVDLAFYVGEHNKNYYLEHGLKSDQLVLARHAVDNIRFQKSQVSKEMITSFRNQLGLLDSDFVVLFAGKLEPRKNPFFLKYSFNIF